MERKERPKSAAVNRALNSARSRSPDIICNTSAGGAAVGDCCSLKRASFCPVGRPIKNPMASERKAATAPTLRTSPAAELTFHCKVPNKYLPYQTLSPPHIPPTQPP